jgi:hypothetical protein
MSCKCDPECRKVYYAQPQLFSEVIEGIPGGAGKTLSLTKITVCTQCGQAEFVVSDQDMQRQFGRSAESRPLAVQGSNSGRAESEAARQAETKRTLDDYGKKVGS